MDELTRMRYPEVRKPREADSVIRERRRVLLGYEQVHDEVEWARHRRLGAARRQRDGFLWKAIRRAAT